MNQENFKLASEAVNSRLQSEDEARLERHRITQQKELPPMDFLFRIFGKPCFPRGELIGVTGKAKSGKTLFTSMLMACCVREEVLQLQRPYTEADGSWQCPPIRCLWYDTEQSEQSTQDILRNRIMKLAGPDPPCPPEGGGASWESYYDVFNVRSLHYDERMRLFEKAVRKYRPDLVVLDGVRDLLADINDGVKAQEVVERLMKLAQETRCCLVCILHQNKGAEDRNLRGWIGTELMNKAFEVYACEKTAPENIFVVEQTHTRKYDLGGLLFFRMDPETEVPVVSDPPAQSAHAAWGTPSYGARAKEQLPPMNRDYIWFDESNRVHVKRLELFRDVLRKGPLYYKDLQAAVTRLLNCGTPLWNNMFCEMRDTGAIVRSRNSQGKTVWTLPARQSPIQPDLYQTPPDQA